MTGRPRVSPLESPRNDLPVVEAAWMALWRAFWINLPLAWADEMDRLLFRWIPPVGEARTADRRGALD